MADRALVVFTDKTDLWWLRGLKRGFRHCFVLIEDGGVWILCDPLAHFTGLQVVDVPDGFDLADWLREDGLRVVVTKRNTQPLRRILWPWPCSCVESVKRLIGVQNDFILTPWQLYRHLTH